MKKLNYLIALLVVGLMVIPTACKKDKDKKPTGFTLVVVKRSTGDLYSVDKATGDLSLIGDLTIDGEPLTGLRGLVYDYDTELCYGGSTNQGGKGFYSINIKTGVSTLLNDDPNDDWDGIADLVMAADGNVLANLYSNIEYNSALVVFNKSTGEDGTHNIITDGVEEVWSPGGLTYGTTNAELILGGYNALYFSNLTGEISDTTVLVPTTNIDDDNVYVMDLEGDADGTMFAIVYEYSDEVQYLVKLDTSTGEITEESVLTSNGIQTGYHCLALIPAAELPY